MKFSKALAFLAILAAGSLAMAAEFGGIISNSTKFQGDSGLNAFQDNCLDLWIRTPFTNDGSIYFATEGTVEFEYKQVENFSGLKYDLPLFKFGVNKEIAKSSIQFSCGRFYSADSTGFIFSQPMDGAYFALNLPGIQLSAEAAYTGLINSRKVVLLDKNAEGMSEAPVSFANGYNLSENYIVGYGKISFPYLIANQTVFLDATTVIGIAGNEENTRHYGTLGFNGQIAKCVFYNVSSTAEFIQDTKDLANLSTLNISIYPNFWNSQIAVNAVYASGKYCSLTSSVVSKAISEPETRGIFKSGIYTSVKPFNNLLIMAQADILFNTDQTFDYNGFQWQAEVKTNIFTDFEISGGAFQFLGAKPEDNNFGLKITAALSF